MQDGLAAFVVEQHPKNEINIVLTIKKEQENAMVPAKKTCLPRASSSMQRAFHDI